MGSYIINCKNTSDEEGTVEPDAGFSYSDKLNEVNEANLVFSGSGEVKRSLIGPGSEVKIYRNETLGFHGIVDDIEYYDGGGMNVHASGYERWLGMENGAYASSPWSSTASATIFASLIGESNYLNAGTINAGTSIDFRVSTSDSIWNAISNLLKKTQQDVQIDYTNSEVDILDHRGSSTSVETLNAGIQVEDVRITKGYPRGNKVIVYGQSEGETRIKSEYPGHGYNAASQASYGIITYIIEDRTITTVAEANLLADAEVARLKDPPKNYEFDSLNKNKDWIAGDVLTLNAPSQEVSNEEVRIVEIKRGIQGNEEILEVEVANKEFSEKTKDVNDVLAQIQKNARDMDTYDLFQDEYSNQNVDTTLGGFMTTDISFNTLNSVRQIANDGALTLGTTSGYKIYLIPSNGDLSADVQVWGHLDMYTSKIKNLANPTLNQDAATKYYVDTAGGAGDNLGNHTATQNLNMNYYGIANCRGGLASGIGYNLDLQPGLDVRLWGDINMNSYDIDNCEDLEVNDIYDYNQGYVYCYDDFELDDVEQIRADTANLRILGGTDPVSIGGWSISGSEDDLFVVDDLDVLGSKNCVVDARDGHKYIFSVIESPEIWFEEKISSQLENGRKEIILDERFLASTVIDKKHPLHTIVTPTSECNGLWVEKKFDRVIVHASTLDSTFDLTISAKRLGYEDVRFDEYFKDEELDIEYKKSKKGMFFEKKPFTIQTREIKEGIGKIRDELKQEKDLERGEYLQTKDPEKIEEIRVRYNKIKTDFRTKIKEGRKSVGDFRKEMVEINKKYKKR